MYIMVMRKNELGYIHIELSTLTVLVKIIIL